MRRLVQSLAFGLLALLGIVQSGAPAFVGEAWSHVAMYQEYQTIMSRQQALDLVLRGDLGCGYFTELEALTAASDTVTLVWLQASQPIVLPERAASTTFAPPPRSPFHRIEPRVIGHIAEALDPPPPRGV